MVGKQAKNKIIDHFVHFKKHGLPFIKDNIYKRSITPLIQRETFGEPLAISDINTIDSEEIEVLPYGTESTLSLDSSSESPTGRNSFKGTEYHFERPKVATITNAKIRGPLGYTSIENPRDIIIEPGADRLDLLYRSIAARAEELFIQRGYSNKYQLDIVTPFIGPMTKTYFHWISDYLLRIRGLYKYEEVHNVFPRLLIPPNSTQWMIDSLKLVGYPEDLITEWDGGIGEVNELVVPYSERHHQPWYNERQTFAPYNPVAFRWLSKKMKEQINLDDGEKRPSTLLISRRDSHTRRIIDLKLLSDTFESDDVEILELSNMSLEEQIRYFHHADVVIAAHGAGLTNIIFGKNLRVIELYGDLYTPLYYGIASGLGYDYAGVNVEQQGDDLIIDEQDIYEIV